MKTDIQIAQEAQLMPITKVAASLNIAEDDLELYGKYKAKFSDELLHQKLWQSYVWLMTWRT